MITILGAGGTIGRALADTLEDGYHNVLRVTRDTLPTILTSNRPLGHVMDCIGLTGDFRTRPLETAQAHVGITAACLGALRCESFLFLSSTRVYARAASTREDAALPCLPADPSDLYNLTKLTGEALCLADPRPTVRVVRLSNVYGPDMPNTFLTQVLNEGRTTGSVRFRQAPKSCKDYISLDDVVALLPRIACRGRHRLYNLSSGRNTSHEAIADVLRRVQGWDIDFEPGAPAVTFPPIEIARLREEFPRALRSLSEDLPTLSRSGQEVQCSPSMRQAVW